MQYTPIINAMETKLATALKIFIFSANSGVPNQIISATSTSKKLNSTRLLQGLPIACYCIIMILNTLHGVSKNIDHSGIIFKEYV